MTKSLTNFHEITLDSVHITGITADAGYKYSGTVAIRVAGPTVTFPWEHTFRDKDNIRQAVDEATSILQHELAGLSRADVAFAFDGDGKCRPRIAP